MWAIAGITASSLAGAHSTRHPPDRDWPSSRRPPRIDRWPVPPDNPIGRHTMISRRFRLACLLALLMSVLGPSAQARAQAGGPTPWATGEGSSTRPTIIRLAPGQRQTLPLGILHAGQALHLLVSLQASPLEP